MGEQYLLGGDLAESLLGKSYKQNLCITLLTTGVASWRNPRPSCPATVS